MEEFWYFQVRSACLLPMRNIGQKCSDALW